MSTRDLTPNTPEWYAARKGRITASNVGAILNVSPFKTQQAALKEMVSYVLNDDTGFSNPAMNWGSENESKAIAVYEFLYLDGESVERTGLWTDEWEDVPVGATPDGLVGDEGLVEIKCPYALRNEKNPDHLFKSADEQPQYWHQMQMQMYITGRIWCDFFQWAPNGHKYERVYADPNWVEGVIDTIKDFYAAYKGLLDKAKVGGPMDKLALSAQWAAAAEELRLASKEMDRWKAEVDSARERLRTLCEDRELDECRGAGVSVQKVMRKGTVDYKALAEDQVSDVSDLLEDYRRDPSTSWRIVLEES